MTDFDPRRKYWTYSWRDDAGHAIIQQALESYVYRHGRYPPCLWIPVCENAPESVRLDGDPAGVPVLQSERVQGLIMALLPSEVR